MTNYLPLFFFFLKQAYFCRTFSLREENTSDQVGNALGEGSDLELRQGVRKLEIKGILQRNL